MRTTCTKVQHGAGAAALLPPAAARDYFLSLSRRTIRLPRPPPSPLPTRWSLLAPSDSSDLDSMHCKDVRQVVG